MLTLQKQHVTWDNVSVKCPHHENGQEFLCFTSGFENLNDMLTFSRNTYADREFIIDGQERMSFQEFFNTAEQISRNLLATTNGIQPGDRS